MKEYLKKKGYKLIPKRKKNGRIDYKAYEELNKQGTETLLKLEEKKGLNYRFKKI